MSAQAALTITSPSNGVVLAAGPDYATDILGDPWDFSNREDFALDPAQFPGWAPFSFANGRVGGTVNSSTSPSGTFINFLQRAYWGILNPGRTGARYPIDTGVYGKFAIKMNSTRNDQFPRVYWFHGDLGDAAGDGGGHSYLDGVPSPSGEHIFTVDLNASPWPGETTWGSGAVRGLGFYPNSANFVYDVSIDWVRLTPVDSSPFASTMNITWTGGSGAATIQVIDAAGTILNVATTSTTATSYAFNYGVLPPGTYTLKITRGTTAQLSFRVNAPPTIKVLDPDESGGEDFATKVIGNPWDMNDPADVKEDATIVDHLIGQSFSGGLFNATSDGAVVGFTAGGIPVGDPQVYVLADNALVDTTRYRYLTFGLQVDRTFDLLRGSVARVFWGSTPKTVGGAPYQVTISKDIITWPGMNTYTIDLGSLTTAANGGIETGAGLATPWMTQPVRYLRLDPHEFAEQVPFHYDFVKLAAVDETTAGSFTIKYTGSDADGDPTSVALYYDTDRDPSSGLTLIKSGLTLAAGQYVWNTSAVPAGTYWICAVVSDGRNSSISYSTGPVRVIPYTPPTDPLMSLDGPSGTVTQPFQVWGWAIDRGAPSGTGVDAVYVYAFPSGSPTGIFLGAAAYGLSRTDVGSVLGAAYTNSGFSLQADYLKAGSYLIAAYAHSTVTGAYQVQSRTITIAPGPVMKIEQPAAGVSRAQPFALSGWAIDQAAASGTGVDAVAVWAYPNPGSGQAPLLLGLAQYGQARSDVASTFGSRFANSGYTMPVKGLAPGTYLFAVFAHSTATGTYNTQRTVTLPVQNAPAMFIDAPAQNSSPAQPFTISGWAIDRAAATGTGVDGLAVYAFSAAIPNGQFIGWVTYGASRPDVAAAFGSAQFTNSGFSFGVNGLAKGTYDLIVYSHSTVSNAYDSYAVLHVTIP